MLTPHQAGHSARSPEAHHNRDHNQVPGGQVVTAPVATSAPAAAVGTDQAGAGRGGGSQGRALLRGGVTRWRLDGVLEAGGLRPGWCEARPPQLVTGHHH